MGLDISMYRRLESAPEAAVDSDGYPVDYDTFFAIRQNLIDFTEKDWPGRTAGLIAGVYRAIEQDGFRAGSYGGYNNWRDHLTRMAYGKSAEALWADSTISSGPFFELIHFSDCEGIIGPVVAKKLATDFAEHQQKMNEYASKLGANGGWLIERFNDWKRAFEMGADDGAIEFH